ncbi:MAG: hypothetical protein K9N57_00285 [Candidatus Marinimicrobia bacterium]|nr:hypothetical protein [Candidatus Neomarinimicrobiota bacterium]
MSTKDNIRNIISWLFGAVFLTLGVLNGWLVHPVPGVFYLLVALLYSPMGSTILKERFGLLMPFGVKINLGLVILWGTLAVGDLAEMFGL